MTTPTPPTSDTPLTLEGRLAALRKDPIRSNFDSGWNAALDAVARQPAPEAGLRVRHGRHCPCSACAREDWTNPDLAACDYHPGVRCLYEPWWRATLAAPAPEDQE